MTIEELYQKYCNNPRDISEHLPTLRKLAWECDHITEIWVRCGLSDCAFLLGIKDWGTVVGYDLVSNEQTDELQELAIKEWRKRDFRIWDSSEIEIDETDMLFIDSLHNGDLLAIELNRHANKARKYIVFHDTETFGQVGETKWHEWLNKPMKDFLKNNKQRKTKKVYKNNNWLTIWKRVK